MYICRNKFCWKTAAVHRHKANKVELNYYVRMLYNGASRVFMVIQIGVIVTCLGVIFVIFIIRTLILGSS